MTHIQGLPDLNQGIDKKLLNPKFGITWNPAQNTTIRVAVFRTLKRLLVTDQTLEPTQVRASISFLTTLMERMHGAMAGPLTSNFLRVYTGE